MWVVGLAGGRPEHGVPAHARECSALQALLPHQRGAISNSPAGESCCHSLHSVWKVLCGVNLRKEALTGDVALKQVMDGDIASRVLAMVGQAVEVRGRPT